MSFSRNAASYFPRPRLRSQTTMSMTAPLLTVAGHHDPCQVGRLSTREVIHQDGRPCLNPAATHEAGAVLASFRRIRFLCVEKPRNTIIEMYRSCDRDKSQFALKWRSHISAGVNICQTPTPARCLLSHQHRKWPANADRCLPAHPPTLGAIHTGRSDVNERIR
jgi:hypothetical protein